MGTFQQYETINILSNDIFTDVFLPPEERRNYSVNNDIVTLPVYFYRIIGNEHENESEYYNEIYNLDQQLKKIGNYLKIESKLDTFIKGELVDKANIIWNEIKADTNLRASYLSANFFGAGILKLTKDQDKDTQFKKAFEKCLEIFIASHKEKNASIIKNFILKMIYWFNKYALKMFKDNNFAKDAHNPKIMFYGDIKKDETYFMIMLSKLGFDIIYINSLSDCFFNEVDPESKYSVKLEFNNKLPIKEFPKTESIIVKETNAYQAERNIESIAHVDNVDLFRPRQFEACNVKSVFLKTTYTELFSLWKEEARYRSGFRIANNTVYVPSIFSKINGTKKQIAAYWTDFLKLVKDQGDFVYIIDRVPFSKNNSASFDLNQFLNSKGMFDKQKIKLFKDYSLYFLKTSIQDNIWDKANDLLEKDYFTFEVDNNVKSKILSTVFNLEREILMLLQRFDYPFNVPKVIIYHNNERAFNIEDFITIALLNAIGLDIVIFSPTGYNNIENGIRSGLYDVHNLDEVIFNLIPPKEVIKEIKKRQISKNNNIFDRFKNWMK